MLPEFIQRTLDFAERNRGPFYGLLAIFQAFPESPPAVVRAHLAWCQDAGRLAIDELPSCASTAPLRFQLYRLA